MDSRLARVLAKIESEECSLDPPLDEKSIGAFEQAHGILLPNGYRQFLLLAGDGGDGPPFYGLDPLVPLADDNSDVQARYWVELPDVRQPFPFTRYWIWDQGQETDEGTTDQVKWGSIRIGHDGCGAYWHLIVTGPERGNVWMIAGEGIQPACPKRDFLTWYEDWLDGKDSFYGFQK
jgi:hypothetical protein